MLNCSKSKETMFTARDKRGKSVQLPTPCLNIERVSRLTSPRRDCKRTAYSNWHDHVFNILAPCNSLLYALWILRSDGIPDTSLRDVFRATVIAKLTYCAPLWSGSCSAADHVKLEWESFVRRCTRHLNTAAVKRQRTVTLLIHFSVESWPINDMSYSLSCTTVIPSLTVWDKERIIRHCWTKVHISITTTWMLYTD